MSFSCMDPFKPAEEFPCDVCGRVLADAKRLYRHLFDVHNLSKDAILDFQKQRRQKKVTKMAKGRSVFNCEECQKPYLSKLGLLNHMVKHHGHVREPPLPVDNIVCPIPMCEGRFNTYFDLATHADVDHRDVVSDPECFQIHRIRFPDFDKFHDWKTLQEEQTQSRFFTRSTETKIRYGRKVWLMKCLHTQRNSKTVDFYHEHCSAFIRVCERFTGEYEVVACFGHIGHPHHTQALAVLGWRKTDLDVVDAEYPAASVDYSLNMKVEVEDEEEVEPEEVPHSAGAVVEAIVGEEITAARFKYEPADLQEELGEFLELVDDGQELLEPVVDGFTE